MVIFLLFVMKEHILIQLSFEEGSLQLFKYAHTFVLLITLAVKKITNSIFPLFNSPSPSLICLSYSIPLGDPLKFILQENDKCNVF